MTKNALQPIEPGEIVHLQNIDRETLAARLKLFVLDLLANDFSRLCSLMYRHDVNEGRFNEALSLPNDDARAEEIARLVIDRELLKIKTRALYAREKNKNQLDE
ncbi:MAG TPA: hypothetical protein PK939_02765 [Bacteroidales bacterium]|nr:hypothetical protein [Bacteroidales bacterium]